MPVDVRRRAHDLLHVDGRPARDCEWCQVGGVVAEPTPARRSPPPSRGPAVRGGAIRRHRASRLRVLMAWCPRCDAEQIVWRDNVAPGPHQYELICGHHVGAKSLLALAPAASRT